MFVKHGMNSRFALLGIAKHYILGLGSSAVFRRQQFLIRTLGGYTHQTHQKRMQRTKAMRGNALEADAEHILQSITLTLDPTKHQGQAGELAKSSSLLVLTPFLFSFLLFNTTSCG
jgi:ATP-dependent NAD(P)H-hydrate dehydratase